MLNFWLLLFQILRVENWSLFWSWVSLSIGKAFSDSGTDRTRFELLVVGLCSQSQVLALHLGVNIVQARNVVQAWDCPHYLRIRLCHCRASPLHILPILIELLVSQEGGIAYKGPSSSFVSLVVYQHPYIILGWSISRLFFVHENGWRVWGFWEISPIGILWTSFFAI